MDREHKFAEQVFVCAKVADPPVDQAFTDSGFARVIHLPAKRWKVAADADNDTAKPANHAGFIVEANIVENNSLVGLCLNAALCEAYPKVRMH